MKKRQRTKEKALDTEEEGEERYDKESREIRQREREQWGWRKKKKQPTTKKTNSWCCAYISVSPFINPWHSPTVINFVLKCFVVLPVKEFPFSHLGSKKKKKTRWFWCCFPLLFAPSWRPWLWKLCRWKSLESKQERLTEEGNKKQMLEHDRGAEFGFGKQKELTCWICNQHRVDIV